MAEIYSKGTARIEHRLTGEIYEVDGEQLEWQNEAEERNMGPEVCWTAEIEHPHLGRLTWELYEYPVGIENYRKTDTAGGHKVIQDLDYGLRDVPEGDDE